jgi:hypothetical protein
MKWPFGGGGSNLTPGQIGLELAKIRENLPTQEEAQRMPEQQRAALNAELSKKIREYGTQLTELSKTDPEAYYYIAMGTFGTDMERISRLASFDERRMLLVFPEKVKEYLQKYLDAVPFGTFASRARDTLSHLH